MNYADVPDGKMLSKREIPWNTRALHLAFLTDDVVRAVKYVGCAIRKPLQEIFDVIEYDSKTGYPKTCGWKYLPPWNGVLWIGEDNASTAYPRIRSDCPLYNPIIERIPPDYILIVDNICVTHQKRSDYATAKLIFSKDNFEVVRTNY